MLFIETPTFMKQITTLLPDDAYNELQSALMANPDAGDLIKGGGGITMRAGARYVHSVPTSFVW